jgi:hypothetical protein
VGYYNLMGFFRTLPLRVNVRCERGCADGTNKRRTFTITPASRWNWVCKPMDYSNLEAEAI